MKIEKEKLLAFVREIMPNVVVEEVGTLGIEIKLLFYHVNKERVFLPWIEGDVGYVCCNVHILQDVESARRIAQALLLAATLKDMVEKGLI